ncbi:MAG: hypothetical protein HC800_08335 [Phormidesmis sp. RL_2_1]|nr:hypothetical protein [Phormidesmis sp. RL_2_1]
MPESQAFYSSLVVEHIVAKKQCADFELWQDTLLQAAKRQSGFIRFDCPPPLPCADDVTKWYTIVHFDSPENLDGWVASKVRQQILERGQKIFRAYRFKSFTTGLEGWFSRRWTNGEQSRLGPPAWKQILSVVFGLYPIVMVRLKLFPEAGMIGEWSPAGAMLLATWVTSAILAIGVMPLVTRLMGFWLYPAYRQAKGKTDILGAAILGLGLIFMAVIFDRL